ncbi:LuxR C-terminal-related transcriptional regulator [Amorphoplanes digitatis]|uniref:DNA-binding CsgD family transcriptional regulator/DNA-binding transcriptional ArsR family regulator n=1 Tax=Actinoplanes digitatis TaxID=1868 RepID=A0A7W7HW71_9ACTN|nr:LuxR family transcriptional regulator [Actinoplanes digitatis]MBB4761849.1 DNA-binding CsgD family transcriptional regulator/DNA-binding transcriptional ArsR family regulator [Actinoplanes digitatis]BFE70526.1 LuxR family transcriptional regulator [Actinoplanes digitatis]GID90960.1 transcriptional regulator [Actinoplanes digitatis]
MRDGQRTMELGQRAPVLPALGRWGLSPHADLIYRSLALAGPATRQQLAGRLGVVVPRVDRALEELVGAGAVHPARRDDGRWSAVAADLVLSRMHRLRAPVRISDQHRRHLAVVAGLHLDSLPPVTVQRLPSRAAARSRIADLVAAERHEHLAINTEDVITADAAAAASPLDRALVARGVRLRTLGLIPRDGRQDPPFVNGGEHRQAAALPLKLMVFDRRSALFPVDPVRFDEGAVEIDDPDAIAHLTQLFYRIWNTAQDPRGREEPPIVLTAREQKIVALLAAGLSEEAAAADLGLSRRTVVYAVRALMDRLGVENRFQLALVLGAARAVPLPSAVPVDPA